MTATFAEFRAAARTAIEDARLQASLETAIGRFRLGRVAALEALPHADALRDHLKRVRHSTLANLAAHLETFEKNAKAAGTQVHWARDAAEACQIITKIAQNHGADMVVKSKSMATEEIHLNQALEHAGITPIETDLGEWIIQLANEPPSHIIAPAIHKTKEQVAEVMSPAAGRTLEADIHALTAEARRVLREKFLTAKVGISGGNIAVAETGSVVLVTNEGNGRMVTSAPDVHIALIGIEKIAPTWDDAAVWLSLLARSATGQPLSIYTNIVTGPARTDDPDGPREVHLVLLDNGRSALLGTPKEELLQCIRCGACLNVCPVYRKTGGHAYGSPYSGPIGAIVSPAIFNDKNFTALPHASSLCGACTDVCPVRIDIPRILLEYRAEHAETGQTPRWLQIGENAAAAAFATPKRMEMAGKLARAAQPLIPGDQLPVLPKQSFRDIWRTTKGLEEER